MYFFHRAVEAICVALVIDVTLHCSAAVVAFAGVTAQRTALFAQVQRPWREMWQGRGAPSPGRALIDFLSQAAECSTEPLEKPVLLHIYHWP